MGETPEVVKIACPGCATQFRLKPKKGRLPEGPVPCPKCAESIPLVEDNIRRKASGAPANGAPQAQVFGSSASERAKSERRGTAIGSPSDTPRRIDDDADDDEFDDLVVTGGLSESNPKSTFLGMGSALPAISGADNRHDKTAVVDNDILAKIRSESSVVEDDDDDQDREHGTSSFKKTKDSLRDTTERQDVFKRQTSENKAILSDALQTNQLEEEGEPNQAKGNSRDKQAPGQMVLGKIKIKKKLKRRSGKPIGARAAKPGATKDSSAGDSPKPSLSKLLKKARDRNEKLGSTSSTGGTKEAADRASADFNRALDDLANETAQAIHAQTDDDQASPQFDVGDSSMIDLLRRRVAEDQQPGAASERRGSGYIRLPTAEIQDVLGQGTYRLRVEDIVYEPIDKDGLTQLVKRGVLLGAEEIADFDGDWMPIADHPVFMELRRKMAREAHDLLKQYGNPTTDSPADDSDVALPAPQAELPAVQANLPARSENTQGPSPSDFAEPDANLDLSGIPTLEADLEEEAEQAARELFDDDYDPNEEPEAPAGPPPMPADKSNRVDVPAESASIQLDYDALGINEEEVNVEESAPPAETDTHVASGGSVRTWIPILAAVVVLGGLAAFAFYPMDSSFLENIMGAETAPTNPTSPTAPQAVNKEAVADKTGAKIAGAINQAGSNLHAALAIDPKDTALQARVAAQLSSEGEHPRAARILGVLWKDRQDDADFAARYTDTLLKAGEHAKARIVAIDAIQAGFDRDKFGQLFVKAVEQNPALGPYELVDIRLGEHADSANAKAEGRRVVLELLNGGASTFTFKPSQSGWENGWRSNIASWRLCQIMVCNFVVPHSQPARIDKASFDKLGVKGPAAARLPRLNWVSEGGKKYVYGVLQDAVAKPAAFPIENTDVWRAWLATGSSAALDQPAVEAISSLEARFKAPLKAQFGDSSLGKIAGELSTVLVFDFLTNNWDRFRAKPEQWGTNLHVAHGSLVSKDNGTAFQPRASTRVKGRFRWTSRFSEDTITSLRLMNPTLVSDKLFPKASAAEKARLEVFWSQRDEVLERADSLSRAHGTKEVLAFE